MGYLMKMLRVVEEIDDSTPRDTIASARSASISPSVNTLTTPRPTSFAHAALSEPELMDIIERVIDDYTPPGGPLDDTEYTLLCRDLQKTIQTRDTLTMDLLALCNWFQRTLQTILVARNAADASGSGDHELRLSQLKSLYADTAYVSPRDEHKDDPGDIEMRYFAPPSFSKDVSSRRLRKTKL